LSSVFLLPKNVKRLTPGVIMHLPDFVGEWYGQEVIVDQGERDILGSETKFARKRYTNTRGDTIFVSIVLSGEDMSSSIHRPERCLPAQGFQIINTHPIKIEYQSSPFTVTRLHNMRQIDAVTGKPPRSPDAKIMNDFNLIYYWFIGSDETTADHTARYLMDIRDRLLKGSYQPWAYITLMSSITSTYQKNGRNEEQTDALIQSFIKQIVPVIQKPNIKTR
jgi:EpsI family protein